MFLSISTWENILKIFVNQAYVSLSMALQLLLNSKALIIFKQETMLWDISVQFSSFQSLSHV